MNTAAILTAVVTTRHPLGATTKSVRDLRQPGHVVGHLITAPTREAVLAAVSDLAERYPRIVARGPFRCDIGWLAAAKSYGLTGAA